MINTQDKTEIIPSFLIGIFIVACIFIGGIFLAYIIHFRINENFVIDQKNTLNPQEIWAWFGGYVGGVSSSILAFLALIALLFSIYHQINEFQKSTSVLKDQNQLLKDQIQEARNIKVSEDEIKKIDATNEFLIEAISAMQDLLAIKKNYFEKLSIHPVERVLSFGPILTNSRVSNFQISKLTFLEKQKNLNRGSSGDIIYLSSVLNDYNTILGMLNTRNDLHIDVIQKPLNESISTLEDTIKDSVEDPKTFNFLCQAGMDRGIKLIHLTEELINFIDRTLKYLSVIIQELPNIAESLISQNILLEYNKIIRYDLKTRQLEVFAYNVPINEDSYNKIIKKYVYKSNLYHKNSPS